MNRNSALIGVKEFYTALEFCAPAMAKNKDDKYKALRGVYFDGTSFISCDSFRVFIYSQYSYSVNNFSLIIPDYIVELLLSQKKTRLNKKGGVVVEYDDSKGYIKTDLFMVSFDLLGCEYMNFDWVVKETEDTKHYRETITPKENIASGLKEVKAIVKNGILSPEDNERVLTFSNGYLKPGWGVCPKGALIGLEIPEKIHFDAGFLNDAVKNMNGEFLKCYFPDKPIKPLRITSDEETHIKTAVILPIHYRG